jgi:TRAP-type C4-dicarboxylate transport system substrate-binding protein
MTLLSSIAPASSAPIDNTQGEDIMAAGGNRLALNSATGALVALAVIALQSPVPAAEFTMKFGTATFNDTQHQYIKFYKEALEKASNGRIEVGIYPRSELGPIPRMIDGLQLGTIEAYIGPADFYVGIDPRFGVFSTPMLFKHKDHATAAVLDPSLNTHILDLGVPKGIKGIGVFATGSSNYAAKTPLLRLADFSGKKLRVNATAMEREKMRRLGATAVPLPLNEVMPSLQRGVIDGTMSGTAIFVAFKMNDAVKTITVTNDTMLVTLAVVSKVWLDKLPPDLQATVIDTGRAIQRKTHEWEVEFSKGLEKTWVSMGGQMHTLPPEDLAKMAELLKSVGDDVSKDQPPVIEMLKRVREVAAKH